MTIKEDDLEAIRKYLLENGVSSKEEICKLLGIELTNANVRVDQEFPIHFFSTGSVTSPALINLLKNTDTIIGRSW